MRARGDHNKAKANGSHRGDKENEIDPNVLTVRRTITISDDEDFSRFCIVSSLVKVIPGSTSLLSAVTVEDCIVRLFRNWLRQKAQQSADEDSQLLWLDQGHNVGIKLRVRERRRPVPVYVNRDNTTAVSYDVYIEGVSFARLLLTLSVSLLTVVRATCSHASCSLDPGTVLA